MGLAGALRAAPLEPDAEEARDWLLDELSKPSYAAARPTLFDTVAQAVGDWFVSLFEGGDGSVPNIVPALIVIAAIGIIVAAFLIFGRPRLNRRSTATGSLFGADDDRSAARLRQSASGAAAAGDYTAAIEDLFRALARSMAERTVVSVTPGTTARDFARRAGLAFPTESTRLAEAATVFDGVRYLDRDGTREQYDELVDLERGLRAARPSTLEPAGASA
ncbi:DUF4129 domain-containing protein [Planctomonas psychrotolerans]|uniref:DUF4129 domain-containing protein n=1 Tax=Planctomonas psychrotolerans TaxID=2528712 RepID=UPI001D0D3D69|nr:DUF4129 domain-containing protein [Planctomonas psychrotolerans]